jgi:hypothetical protein
LLLSIAPFRESRAGHRDGIPNHSFSSRAF